ncbi:MAG: hypothetical protein MJY63_05900, partial [Paludibacteraceae bacterium]|nr:hypothetical protein [Paludibacteraceae bacterium]
TTVTDTITPVIPDTIVPIIPDTVVTDTITPVIPDTIVPINPDTTVTDTIIPVIPDTIVPINPDTTVTDTIIPVIPDTIVNDTTGFEDMINDEFAVYASKGCVYVKSTKSGTVDVYDVLSRLIVKSAPYSEGVTMVATLPKGIYIIEGKKIIVR